jgi:hypothetical protein
MFVNAGPSLDTQAHQFNQLSGFSQRFMIRQDDPRWFPGRKEPHLPAETMKGTFKLAKAKRSAKRVRCADQVPKGQPDAIYGGYDNVKAEKPKVQRKKRRKKRAAKVKK